MKLTFNIQDVPEGSSQRQIHLEEGDLDLDSYPFKGAELNLAFYRTLHFIRIEADVDADVELVCDRTLESFIHNVDKSFEIIYKVDAEEEVVGDDSLIRPFNFETQEIDIEDDIRDTILLEIPIKKVHPRFRDEEGEITDFEPQTYGEAPDAEEQIDPRWSKLKKLKQDNDNS